MTVCEPEKIFNTCTLYWSNWENFSEFIGKSAEKIGKSKESINCPEQESVSQCFLKKINLIPYSGIYGQELRCIVYHHSQNQDKPLRHKDLTYNI